MIHQCNTVRPQTDRWQAGRQTAGVLLTTVFSGYVYTAKTSAISKGLSCFVAHLCIASTSCDQCASTPISVNGSWLTIAVTICV